MKAVVAMLKHETNTFSPVPTPLSRFGPDGPRYGEAALQAMRGTRTCMGAFIDLCEAAGIEVATPVAADARPSGPASAEVFEALCEPIVRAVEQGCDLVMLDLHGAMVTEMTDDGEGTLLKRLRDIRPDLPIAVALDMHANLTAEMVENCTVLAGYRTYPHVDHHETGTRAGKTLLDAIQRGVAPRMAWGRLPSLAHTLRMGTDDEPFKTLLAQAEQASQEPGVIDAVVFGGFALADIAHPCPSFVVVMDGDPREGASGAPPDAHGKSILHRLLRQAWRLRDQWVYRPEPLESALARAAALHDGPVLLIDHADNCASGGTQDTMRVLEQALRHGMQGIVMFAVCDPQAVQALIDVGVGGSAVLPVGGKTDMPALRRAGRPLTLSGRVRTISDGQFVLTGRMQTGARVSMGRTVVFETEQATVVICERHHEPWDLACLRAIGLEPTQARYLILKSRMAYRAAFLPIARAVIECDGEGVTSSDYGLFPYRRLVRPVHPLDAADFDAADIH